VKEAGKQTNKWWYYVKSNLLNGLFIIALLILIFSPDAKALVIKGLMQIGFFKPDINDKEEDHESAADVTFTNVSGADINLSSLKGKVVFLNFWATWCPPCIAEMPGINELHKQFLNRTDVVFVVVDADGDLNKSGTFLRTHGYNLPLYIFASGSVSNLFTDTLPSTLIIDREGKIVFRKTGAANYNTKQFKDFINKLAAE
jgi:thiol-disulfide isomerase/thioredoxin